MGCKNAVTSQYFRVSNLEKAVIKIKPCTGEDIKYLLF